MDVQTDASVFKPMVSSSPNARSPRTPSLRTYNYEIGDREHVVVESTTNVKKFIERYDLSQDRFEYERSAPEPGLVLIFNQENFDYKSSRKGSRRDVNEIVICLQRCGFNIDEENIKSDGNREEILNKLNEVSEMDLSIYNCLIVFFLTHGDDFNRLDTKSETISTNEIFAPFVTCKDLKHKPKMFVFQACKGDSYSTTGNVANSSVCPKPSSIVPTNTFSRSFIVPDMLIVYSTIEGNVAYRSPLTGSWFIQELCKNFNSYGRRDDVVSLIIRATKCVSANYFHNEDNANKKQMPMFVTTLTKKFYLNRNKDRDLLIKVINSHEEIIKELKDIKTLLEEAKTKKLL